MSPRHGTLSAQDFVFTNMKLSWCSYKHKANLTAVAVVELQLQL